MKADLKTIQELYNPNIDKCPKGMMNVRYD